MMTDQQHPISPPWELVEKWAIESPIQANDENWAYELYIAHHAACWGADQELEACCEWVSAISGKYGPRLRLSRRPKPPSLKEQALGALGRFNSNAHTQASQMIQDFEIIRRALQQLDD